MLLRDDVFAASCMPEERKKGGRGKGVLVIRTAKGRLICINYGVCSQLLKLRDSRTELCAVLRRHDDGDI